MNTNKYYLKINDRIINFNKVEGLTNMEDYLNLSLLTGLFDDEYELTYVLYLMGLIDCDDVYDISIVKCIKKESIYSYDLVTKNLLFDIGSSLLSSGRLKVFLYRNRKNYEVMYALFDSYRTDLDGVISTFEQGVSNQAKINSRNHFYKKYNALTELIALAKYVSTHEDNIAESKFLDLIGKFVDEQVYYHSKLNTPNNRGLVKLATRIQNIIIDNPSVVIIEPTKQYNNKRNQYTEVITDYLSRIKFSSSIHDNTNTEDDIDPDSYMFLEPEDYYSLLNVKEPSKEYIESVENSILNLEIKKRRQISNDREYRKFLRETRI